MKNKKNETQTETTEEVVLEAEQAVDKRDETIEGLKKELLYQAAEVENFKRRTEKRYADALKYATEPLLKDLLSVLDNLERAAQHVGDAPEAVTEGLLHIADQLRNTIVRHGVVEIEAEGAKFDPNLHEALAMVPGAEDNLVMMVQEKGYTIHGKLLRPAKVLVSKVAG